MNRLDPDIINRREKFLRRSIDLLVALAALLLPGGLLLMFVLWLYRRAHLSHGKTVSAKS